MDFDFVLLVCLEQTIWIPVVVSLIRFRVIKPLYIPLFIYLVAKGLLELSANVMAVYVRYNGPPYNVLYLLEALLLSWQLFNMGAFRMNKKLYLFTQLFWIALWIVDVFLIGSFKQFNIVFHITYSFILVFVAANLFSKLAITVKRDIIHNAQFWLCMIFTFWYTYNIMYEFAEYLSSLQPALATITKHVTIFMGYSGVVIYLVITWAILCIPEKNKFSIV